MTKYDSSTHGDTSIESLYQTHHRPLVAYLTRLVRDRATAEDLCQETFLKVMRGWASRRSTVTTTAWLYRIATNAAYDHLRRQRASFTPLTDADWLPSAAYSQESQLDVTELVQRTLARLPACYRMLLILYICQGYGLDEIAATLGCSRNAVKMRLSRARQRFQQVYQR